LENDAVLSGQELRGAVIKELCDTMHLETAAVVNRSGFARRLRLLRGWRHVKSYEVFTTNEGAVIRLVLEHTDSRDSR
jgi:hypothetical protein